MIGHFSADELASYRAGAVRDNRAAKISAHLSVCVRCAEVDSDLANLSWLLARMPAPPMPDRLTERLQAAIAAEAAERAGTMAVSPGGRTVSAGGTGPVHTPGRPDLPRRARYRAGRRRMPGWSSPLLLRGLAATAALVVLVGGAALLIHRSESSFSTAIGPGSAPAHENPRPAFGMASAPAAAIELRYRHDGQFAYTSVLTTDANYTEATIGAAIRQKVAATAPLPGPSNAAPSMGRTAAAAGEVLHGFRVGQLEACLSAVAAGRLVRLAEVARYRGLPATIIVLQPVGDVFDVIVVGQACGASGEDIVKRLTVPRL